MLRTLITCAALLLAPLSLLAAPPSPPATLSMKTQFLHDDGLDKDAYSVLVPDGWKLQGAIQWIPTLPTPFVDISVSNPTLHAAWRQFPRILYLAGVRENQEALYPAQRARIEQQFAEGQLTQNGYEVREFPRSAADYVVKILSPNRCLEVANATDLKITSEQSLPDYAKVLAAADPLHRDIAASRVRMTYTAPDGPAEREWLVIFITSKDTNPQRIPNPSLWITDTLTWRAPRGTLDPLRPTFTTIGSSVRVQLPWFNQEIQCAQMFLQQQQQNNARILQNQRDAINERMKILREEAQQSSQIVSDSIRNNFQAQQAAKDQSQRQFIHYINDTAAYKDPNDGSTLTLDAGYKYQYISNHGDIIQTNDPTLTPPPTPQTSWSPLQKSND